MTFPHHTLAEWTGILSTASLGASIACNLLPNDKYLAEYPRLQRFYRTFIAFTAAAAFNLRHCLPSLDIPAPALGITKPPANCPKIPDSSNPSKISNSSTKAPSTAKEQ